MVTHSGTHIDVPKHHLAKRRDRTPFPLQKFIGEAAILAIEKRENDKTISSKAPSLDLLGSP